MNVYTGDPYFSFGDFGGKGVSIGMIHSPKKRLNYGLKSSDLPSSR